MSTITKQWLQQKIADMEATRDEIPFGLDEDDSNTLAALRYALASLEAEPVAWLLSGGGAKNNVSFDSGNAYADPLREVTPLYTAPPAQANAEPVAWLWSHRKHPSEVTLVRPEDDERADGAHWSGWNCLALYAAPPAPAAMKDHQIRELVNELRDIAVEYHGTQQLRERIARTIRAAMLQGAEPVTTTYKLPDDFDFDRFNDVVWLEAVASNPRMHSLTTSTIAMVALELNRKLADGKPELTVWYGAMPETNGKTNWTAILHRKGEGRCMDGFTIDRSEYPGRVLYAADRVRYLIGEKSERPSILDYDADAHSGYVEPVTTANKLPFDQWLSQQTGTIDVECGCVMTEVFFHWLRVAYEAGNFPQCREISNSSTNNFRENAETSTKCWCRTCRPVTFADSRFVVCPECGNKRCPHANDHRNACTGSNEPGQEGSAYPAAPQQEVK